MGEPSENSMNTVATDQKEAEVALAVANAADATEAARWAAARAAAVDTPAAAPQQTAAAPQYTVTGPAVNHPTKECPPAHVSPHQVVVVTGAPESEKKLADA